MSDISLAQWIFGGLALAVVLFLIIIPLNLILKLLLAAKRARLFGNGNAGPQLTEANVVFKLYRDGDAFRCWLDHAKIGNWQEAAYVATRWIAVVDMMEKKEDNLEQRLRSLHREFELRINEAFAQDSSPTVTSPPTSLH